MCPRSGKETSYLLHSIAKDQKEVREFLGAAEFCCIWIPRYSSLAKPLYGATAGSGKDPLNRGPDQDRAFQEKKRLLSSAPMLGLLDVI
jgi:hypothetical protein